MAKTGLVLEGGGMRGMFTVGVTDVLMEHGVEFDGVVGVSAGAAFGCNYKSRQPGRALRYNVRYCRDRRYCGLWSLLTTGNLFGAWSYHELPERYDIFDTEAYEANPMEFIAVCTDVETGLPVYHECRECTHETYDWIRASASMPLASRIVHLGGQALLDGGVTDSIPLEFMERRGYDRNLVILTQPEGYQKQQSSLQPVLRWWMRRYPRFVEAMDRRPEMYNAQLRYVHQRAVEGKALVLCPDAKLPINHVTRSPQLLRETYDLGRAVAERQLPAIEEFLASGH